jgi:hypothetical protein
MAAPSIQTWKKKTFFLGMLNLIKHDNTSIRYTEKLNIYIQKTIILKSINVFTIY